MTFLGSASGLTPQQLRAKRYVRLSRDVYALRSAIMDLRLRTDGVLLAFPDAVPCGLTAALLQGLPVDDDRLLHLARHRKAPRSERPGVKIHRTPVEADERLDLGGLVVADGPRVFVDLARGLDLEALVAVGDVLLRRYNAKALREAVSRRARRPGLPLARVALPLLDAGADSPAESRGRLRLHAAGFTGLRHGVVVRGPGGGWLAKPDLGDEVARVALQYDGLVHLEGGLEQRRKDLQRDELTRQADWQVVIATALDDRRPHLLVEKVTDAYRRAGRQHGAHVLPLHLQPRGSGRVGF